jgi:glucose-1-phosphate cytidylyltransferase
MQVVILAGGLGTRLAEETITLPKPMVSIGEEPILVHLMRFYASQGHSNFVIALGYKGFAIKEYFRNFTQNSSNLRIETKDSSIKLMDQRSDDWTIDLIDTGLNTATGGRISRLTDYLDNEFLMTYGDGLSNVNLDSLIDFHRAGKTLATVTAVKPPARFGALAFNGNFVTEFSEKSKENVAWINGGFFVLNKKILDYIDSDETAFEESPLRNLAQENQLAGFKHYGFWQPMDTLRDKMHLEEIWQGGSAPWTKALNNSNE